MLHRNFLASAAVAALIGLSVPAAAQTPSTAAPAQPTAGPGSENPPGAMPDQTTGAPAGTPDSSGGAMQPVPATPEPGTSTTTTTTKHHGHKTKTDSTTTTMPGPNDQPAPMTPGQEPSPPPH